MPAIRRLDSDNFSAEIVEGVTLVDFWAPWCTPCRLQDPVLENVAERVGERVKVAKVNVDEAGQVAMEWGVDAIPTLLIFKNGVKVQRIVGLAQADELLGALELVLAPT